jgi:hypothetical protein
VKLEECEEEFDETKRVAEFAFRFTNDTNSNPLISPMLSMALKRQIPKTKTKTFLDQLIVNIMCVYILVVGGVGTVTIVVIVGIMLGSKK